MPVRLDDRLASSSASLIKLGRALMGSGEGGKAVALFRRLLAERPSDAELQSAAKAVLAHGVPQWHASMLRDTGRNDAYERAIRRVVRPGSVVLDIGSGSGLLALMAARAGAAHVYSCEAHPAIAETARDIVSANGMTDRVTVISKHSTDLQAERDIGGGADVIITEIFSDDLLCEGALASLDHAARHLSRPGVQFIPSKASIRVALAYRDLPSAQFPAFVNGFDLSLFERHVAPHQPISTGHKRLKLKSASQDLFTFEFGRDATVAPARAELVLTSSEQPVNGLVQWIHLQLDTCESYENMPTVGALSHWGATFYGLPDRIGDEVPARIAVHADHVAGFLRLWFPGS